MTDEIKLNLKKLTIDQASTSLTLRDNLPGVADEKGNWTDVNGIRHYTSGGTYQPAEIDHRLKAGGAYSGNHTPMQFTPSEVEDNPWLGIDPKDYRTLLMFMDGKSRREIARELKISEMTVTTRLAKPIVKRCIETLKDDYESDIHSLTDLAVRAVRDALDPLNNKISTRLSAADRVFKLTGRDRQNDQASNTATNDMQKLLAAFKIDINVHNREAG